jgi:hypothetical protein
MKVKIKNCKDGAVDALVDDLARVRHDAAALAVAEQVHGHLMTPATTNATNPTVGPRTMHGHGLLRVPHCTQIGTIVAT